jgi:hypothetical protein
MKICSKCKIEKNKNEFGIDNYSKTGLTSQCKLCRNEYNKNSENFKILKKKYKIDNYELIKKQNKEYYNKNKIKILDKNKKWSNENKDRHRYLTKEWSKNNKEKLSGYTKKNRNKINKRVLNRTKTNPLYKLRRAIASRISSMFRVNNWKKNGKTESILGCTFQEAKIHLEKQFKEGMSWDNHGEWHIDHIKPLSLAKSEQELIDSSHYTNLQPLWAKENIIKSNKYNI